MELAGVLVEYPLTSNTQGNWPDGPFIPEKSAVSLLICDELMIHFDPTQFAALCLYSHSPFLPFLFDSLGCPRYLCCTWPHSILCSLFPTLLQLSKVILNSDAALWIMLIDISWDFWQHSFCTLIQVYTRLTTVYLHISKKIYRGEFYPQ